MVPKNVGPRARYGVAVRPLTDLLDVDDLAWPERAAAIEFTGGVRDDEWGRVVRLKVPGAGELEPYQPEYDPPATAL